MDDKRSEVLNYWNDEKVQSMYDKHLIALEIYLIKSQLRPGMDILDAGCGEGEGTLEYSDISGVNIIAADFSDTRLEKAKINLGKRSNVSFQKVDFLSEFQFDRKFDAIICQRFLINLINEENQFKTISRLASCLKSGGMLILLEGSIKGTEELNRVRKGYDLAPIDFPWHNTFFDDARLENYASGINLDLNVKGGLGSFYLLTRAIRPSFEKDLNWKSSFNEKTAELCRKGELPFDEHCSRTRFWVFKNKKK